MTRSQSGVHHSAGRVRMNRIMGGSEGVGENVTSQDFFLDPSNTSLHFHFRNTIRFVSGYILYFLSNTTCE